MADDDPAAKPALPVRARRWTRDGTPSGRRSTPYRLAFRLIGIPVIAVAGVILYRGLREHFVLPACDSDSAQKTLSQVLTELKLEPVRYSPITTVSSSSDKVVCSAVLPLPDGGNVVVDYTLYWQGDKASMRYSIHHQPAQGSQIQPSPPAQK